MSWLKKIGHGLKKVGAWAWAHKQEIAAGWATYKGLRDKRKAGQREGETAREYYMRIAKEDR